VRLRRDRGRRQDDEQHEQRTSHVRV
jgi:hypothetical protein